MKKNTKNFLNFIERVEGGKRNYNINNLVSDFVSMGFSVDDNITIEYINKNLKPADLKNIYEKEKTSNIYFITAIKNKKTYNNNNEYNFYCFMYDCNGEKIKEKNIRRFNFCYCTYESNAYYRNNAVFTILIYQNKKYIEAMNQKKQLRIENNKNYNGRYIFTKDFYNEYSEEENRQRYKYYKSGFDPKKRNNILIDNIVLKNKYSFNKRYTGFYYRNEENILIDKSGYILTYKRNELKRKASELKEKNALKRFNESHYSYYLDALKNDKKSIENQVLKAYQIAVKTGKIENIVFMNKLYSDRIDPLLNKIDRYILKLENKDFSNGIFNNSVVSFESTLRDLHKDYYNYIYTLAYEYNIYLNFKKLDDIIRKKTDYSEYENYMEKNGLKYPCCENNYKSSKYYIKNNVLYFLDYQIEIVNYFDFLN